MREHPDGLFLSMTTVGIIGAGNIGGALARASSGLGYDVVIANSRGPETLQELVDELGPAVRAATASDAAAAGDFAVVTVPLKAIGDLPVRPLAGKIVLDTNNYYFERDGHVEPLDRGQTTTSEMVQRRLPESKVVKAFNHIMSTQINTDGTPAGTADRRALGTASDHDDAIALVTDIYDRLGFDTVNVGPLSESWRLERDRPTYVVRQTATELREAAARANRLP
ncbi:NADPH-dependent F420 reductase [Microbacterium aquimaris]|uniref:NAD(P)-binding domain-containing protein n=1 Tax=Microbacterium aquimaris TaxID=459816 RepID=A0ABU5N2J5_9MICO|nr:NAD(P)-binding domain-containing protein [Microbacterium aquimaris]MDZ8160297.1 NAD(P)-binding domain-containing protein [Microbacterium aquimaris]